MLVLISARSMSSPHVRREVERAVNLDIELLPVRLEPVEPTGAFEYFISGTQRLDAFPAAIEHHADDIAAALGGVPARRPQPIPANRRHRRGWLVPVGLFASALALAAVWLVVRALLADPTPGPVTTTSVADGGATSTVETTGTTESTATTTAATTVTSLGPNGITETFDDNRNDWGLGTFNVTGGEQFYEITEGHYEVSVSANAVSESFYSVIAVGSGPAIYAQVNVQPIATPTPAPCGLSFLVGDDTALFASVTPATGIGHVTWFSSNGLVTLLEGPAAPTGNPSYEVGLSLDGATGTLWIDRVMVGTFPQTFPTGEWAGTGIQFGESMTCWYDDLWVTRDF